jgi:exosortase
MNGCKWMTETQSQRFLILFLLCLFVGWHAFADTLALAWHNDQYTHILLILPISGWLIYLNKPAAKPLGALKFRVGGVIILSFVLTLTGVMWYLRSLPPDLRTSLLMFALVASWVASFVLCFGFQTSRSLLFPLLFLFWLIPFPDRILGGIVDCLQKGSARVAQMLFAAADVSAVRSGFTLIVPGITIEVAKECSSVRSSLMLLVTTMVLAHLFLRSFRRQVLITAVAVPLSVAKNGLRIFTIVMLGTRVDPGFLTGRLHHHGGVVFFIIALAGELLLLLILHRAESPITGASLTPART